jgi:hypothetical protein
MIQNSITAKIKKTATVEQRAFNDNASNRAKDYIRKAFEEIKPYGAIHAETIVLSFFTTNDIITGKTEAGLVSYKVLAKDSDGKEYELLPEIRQQFLTEARDRLWELMGAKLFKGGAKTTEQVLDELRDAGASNEVINDFKKEQGLND